MSSFPARESPAPLGSLQNGIVNEESLLHFQPFLSVFFVPNQP